MADTRPITLTVPIVGESVPAMICSKVDFPLPLVPITPMISPLEIVKDISRNAQNSLKNFFLLAPNICNNLSLGLS